MKISIPKRVIGIFLRETSFVLAYTGQEDQT